MASSLENLQAMRSQLERIYEHLPRITPSADRPPIIDVLDSNDRGSADHDEETGVTTSASVPGKSSPSNSGSATKERNTLRHLSSNGIPGLRVLRDNVRHDIEQIDKFLARLTSRSGTNVNISAFSTNAPYLIAVWNELVRAPQPVVSVDKTFSGPPDKSLPKNFSKKGAAGTKVDVVADNGRHWIRVNTIKNSRLLAEFRELDSYLNGSEGEDGECTSGDCISADTCRTKPSSDELDNSLLQMGKGLLVAAGTLPQGSGEIAPTKITLRLTRLLLNSASLEQLESLGLRTVGSRDRLTTSDLLETDPRVAQTIHELLKMGLDVALGEHEFQTPPELSSASVKPQPRLVPSRQINLDLSVLIALISDITHAPLPCSRGEAYTRYIPTPVERARSRRRRLQQKEMLARAKAKKGANKIPGHARNKQKTKGSKRCAENFESDTEAESVHSRALANQVLREIDMALLDEIVGRLEPVQDNSSPVTVEFWTSKEVRNRCVRIVEKIGGPAEKRRASALFFDPGASSNPILGTRYASVKEAADAYWCDSRHSRDTLPRLAPLRIFEDTNENVYPEPIHSGEVPLNPFWADLERACIRLLSSGSTSHPRGLSLPSNASPTSHPNEGPNQLNDFTELDKIERAAVTFSNARLTVHTVSTLYKGAGRHWTTLTANRASVREMLKEITKESCAIPSSHSSSYLAREDKQEGKMRTEVAAIWVVEPRSLAESMREDYIPESD